MKFKDDHEALLDAHFNNLLCDDRLAVPGLVVFARRGNDTYHKAFGMSDLATSKPMARDAMFRMFSMTKVLTSFVDELHELLDWEKPGIEVHDKTFFRKDADQAPDERVRRHRV